MSQAFNAVDPQRGMRSVVRAGLAVLLAGAGAASAQPQVRTLAPASPVVVTFHGGVVVGLPDVNGDGKADIAVGSFFSVNHIGRVHVYSGATGQLIRQLVSPNLETDDLYGSSLAAVPDINGDGVADITVGAPMDSPSTSPQGCGRVYLYSGATGQLIRKLIPPSPQYLGQFGYAVAGLRDLNGDGAGEIAVGAPGERQGQGDDDGRVHIYSGVTGARLRTILPPVSQHSGDFGHAVASIADLSGDGRDELVIGDHRAGTDQVRGGRVYIYSPADGQLIRTLRSPNDQDDGRFGEALAVVPDTNGDGKPDIVVGAPREFGRSGRAYLFSGATGVLLARVQSPGLEADARFGEAVAGLPDLNGDGRGEFIVGAPHEDPGNASSDNGRAYVFSGDRGRFVLKLLPPVGRAEEYFGFSVAGLPDTNGNGRPEIVIGAPGEDSPAYGPAGAAYLFRY